ncbi:MAG: hypothetical protein KKB59_14100 [Spirochaetes bacterium]|nr:hypothetical protein [Spirochaetota bacterium]
MIHVCIYNETTKEIEGAESYDNQPDAYERWSMYEVECRGRGGDAWKPYSGDKPFEFPPLAATEDDPDAIPTTAEVVENQSIEENPDA